MKIVFVAHNASVEGSGLAFASLCKQFAEKGNDVVAVVPAPWGVYDLVDNIENVRPVVIREIKNEIYPRFDTLKNKILFLPRLLHRMIFRIRFRRKFRKLLAEESPDIVHTNVGTIRVPAQISKEMGVPHVWHVRECQVRGYDFKPFGGEKKVEKLYHDPANKCIAITRSVFEYYNLRPYCDKLIYDGVFTCQEIERRASGKTTKRKVILYVGLISENKGVPMLLEAFDNVADRIPDYELWLAGRDDLGLAGIVKQMNNSSRVKYLGFRKDVYDLMASARALVVPSNYEGFGFITAEAMLNHTLVLGRDFAGTKEQLDNGLKIKNREIGLRFKTMPELEKCLVEAVEMPEEEYRRITDDAFDVATSLYTTERSAEEVLAFYDEILKEYHG